ncbi:MAG: AraC family transcriptional regulator [Sphaerochaetaceae bacterium]
MDIRKKINKINYCYNSIILSETFPLDFHYFQVSRDSISSLHYHDIFEVGICIKGFGIFVLNKEIYSYKPGDVFVIGPEIMHRAQSDSKSEDLWAFLSFRPEDWSSIKLPRNMKLVRNKLNNPDMHSLLIFILDELKNKQLGYEGIIHGYLESFINLSNREYKNSEIGREEIISNNCITLDSRVREAIDIMMSFSEYQLSISEIAKRCNISVSYLRKLFVEQTNLSPKSFQMKIYIKRAMSLLVGSNRKIVDIAFDCGFNSLTSFNRQFTKDIGMTPFEWRKRSCS